MTETLTLDPLPAHGGNLAHQALIYGSDDEFLAATVPFCLDGLEQGDAVLAVTTPGNTDLLRQALDGARAHIDFGDTEEWYRTPGRTLGDYYRYVDRLTGTGGHRRVRVIGEPVWTSRDALETAEWTRYEAAVNVAFADCPAWIVCPYDTRVLPEDVVAGARRTHPVIEAAATVLPSDRYVEPTADGGWRRPLQPLGTEDGDLVMRFGTDLSAVRAEVAASAVRMGLSEDGTRRLVFAVNEVATNAVQHGGGAGELVMRRSGRRVVCDVTSTGDNDSGWFVGYLPPDPQRQRGHGMWVVRQLCDLLEVHTAQNSTTVRLHVSLG
ncbi:sensor histidine kinase [Streptomyces sp. NPDC006284]|uniref:sensor histidine kinase n=1 Tax=unclassified Streptomyces TaxID=2593676 RepID=UPI0033B3BBF1